MSITTALAVGLALSPQMAPAAPAEHAQAAKASCPPSSAVSSARASALTASQPCRSSRYNPSKKREGELKTVESLVKAAYFTKGARGTLDYKKAKKWYAGHHYHDSTMAKQFAYGFNRSGGRVVNASKADWRAINGSVSDKVSSRAWASQSAQSAAAQRKACYGRGHDIDLYKAGTKTYYNSCQVSDSILFWSLTGVVGGIAAANDDQGESTINVTFVGVAIAALAATEVSLISHCKDDSPVLGAVVLVQPARFVTLAGSIVTYCQGQ